MNFIKIEDKIETYREHGFEHGDNVIALLSGGEVKIYVVLWFVR